MTNETNLDDILRRYVGKNLADCTTSDLRAAAVLQAAHLIIQLEYNAHLERKHHE
ncbi:hypothetical protein [Hoyosella altamirensis]|uniref:Uncharacterized protein n=1 Tax=Hoyosella altamirensis TaxID=616997 RepID=A0A839RLS0_9ACTN|nr:hypothetical protein [Hoyosella altamirensis]MBB3037433.1 hypothetical protein [Hoyosella altamirensis]MBB3037450.1 hypothetical protein [Hoyosella altamirensis]